MIRFDDCFCLAHEPGSGPFVAGWMEGHELQSDSSIECVVLSQIDLAHPSDTDVGDYLIVGDFGTRGQVCKRSDLVIIRSIVRHGQTTSAVYNHHRWCYLIKG